MTCEICGSNQVFLNQISGQTKCHAALCPTNKKEKQIDVVMSFLESVYCDTCCGSIQTETCEDCHRKSMNWSISRSAATRLIENILDV